MNEFSKTDQGGRTLDWLEERYRLGVDDGRYLPFQPIFGYGERSEAGQVTKYARVFQILTLLGKVRFDSFLDVGGAEGFTANLVRQLYRARVVNSDISTEACKRSREFFDLHALSADSTTLPFGDDSFDVVLLSEVLEHVADPAMAMLEGLRVCRKALILSTDEVCLSEPERRRRMALVDHTHPHIERTYFTPEDFLLLLGEYTSVQSTMFLGDWDGAEPPPGEEHLLRELILRLTSQTDLAEGSLGILAVKEKTPGCLGRPRFAREKLLDLMLAVKAETLPEPNRSSAAPQVFPRQVAESFRCPQCRGPLSDIGPDCALPLQIRCAACGSDFPVEDGIPVLRAATAEKIPAPLRPRYEAARHRFTAVRPLSKSPADIGAVEPLEGIVDPRDAFQDDDIPFFFWCLQRASFRLRPPWTPVALSIILCSHYLNPPMRLTVKTGQQTAGDHVLRYGWQELRIPLAQTAAESGDAAGAPNPADHGPDSGSGQAPLLITLEFDRPMRLEELLSLNEVIPGMDNMPEDASVRLHAVRPVTAQDLLHRQLEDAESRMERMERAFRFLAQRQARLEQLKPVRLYKKLRGMDW